MPRASRRRRHPVAPAIDGLARAASVTWRSLFATAAGLCLVAGVLHATGAVDDAYALVLVAGACGALASVLGLVALRVEPSVDPYDPYVLPDLEPRP